MTLDDSRGARLLLCQGRRRSPAVYWGVGGGLLPSWTGNIRFHRNPALRASFASWIVVAEHPGSPTPERPLRLE